MRLSKHLVGEREERADPENWVVLGNFGEHMGLAGVCLGIAAISSLILAYRIVPEAVAEGGSFAAGLLIFTFVVIVAGPIVVGATYMMRFWSSPRSVTIGSSSVSFELFRRTKDILIRAVASYETSYTIFSGPSILIQMRGGPRLRIADLPTHLLDSIVGRFEAANPSLDPEESWAWARMADGTLVRDRRLFRSSEAQAEAPLGCWCSPIKGSRAAAWAWLPALAAIVSMFPFVVAAGGSDPIAGAGAASLEAASLMLVGLAIAIWQASRINRDSTGVSSLQIDEVGPLTTMRAIESAIARTGATGVRGRDLWILGFEFRRWRIGRDVRVSFLFPPRGDWGRIKVRTRKARSLELHQRSRARRWRRWDQRAASAPPASLPEGLHDLARKLHIPGDPACLQAMRPA